MKTKVMVLATTLALAATACSQDAARDAAAADDGPTPEEIAERAAERQAELDAQERPIEALNSVWLEELTWMEIRDAIRNGSTTALILTGGVESNGPYLASGKHNYSNQLLGESVARALGNTLVAPLVTLEPGRPSGPVTVGNTGPMVSQDTYIRWLIDMGDSLRGMGFTEIYYLGDSGGNLRGMQAAADSLNARYGGSPAVFHHVEEFYNHEQVRRWIQEDLGIPEELEYTASRGSDGIHDELSISSVMAALDPTTIRFEQRVDAGLASINGIDLEPLEETRELGRQVVDFRTDLTVEAIEAFRAEQGL
ncbi:MAG: creatininase family protein [Gemmatimonadota bacterium]|nr:creatininase family protein [Gemmatimonadota bacterium]